MSLRDFTKNYIKQNHKNWAPFLRKVERILCKVPLTHGWNRNSWVKNTFTQFANDQHQFIFLSIARFCHINRPVSGYYFEFGCHEANTMCMAWNTFKYLFDWTYVGFDSFEGLPEITNIDKQQIWEKGKLKTGENKFVRKVTKQGIPRNKLITVKGFYDESLTPELCDRLLPTKAAVIYIDCDLYKSTVPVLEFIKPFLQIGTIVVFDDWNCFYGDPDRGERRAFHEFCGKNPELIFESFVETNEGKAFIFIGESKDKKKLENGK
jgi:hypothetical protein